MSRLVSRKRDDRNWILATGGSLIVVVLVPLVLLRVFGQIEAILTLVGVLVTASVSFLGLLVTRQSNQRLREEGEQVERRLRQDHEDEQNRLKLDAAMRAGALLAPSDVSNVSPAAAASGLLALTKLDQAGLAVVLLVDLWSGDKEQVSTEAAVLIIDSALRSTEPKAQLVAAELLCRNAKRLDSCQSLHWPSVIDGCWDPTFGPKTKLLLLDALLGMTLSRIVNENALRSVAVRLYGVWQGDPDDRVRGCVGALIAAVVPQLEKLGYQDFMQGNQKVLLQQLLDAAASATANPDGFLDRLVSARGRQLAEWAALCDGISVEHGSLATATPGPIPS
jgi:hypothetical protein